jgi:hypothetical protein
VGKNPATLLLAKVSPYFFLSIYVKSETAAILLAETMGVAASSFGGPANIRTRGILATQVLK